MGSSIMLTPILEPARGFCLKMFHDEAADGRKRSVVRRLGR